ncbi:transporting ATPase [Halioglobus sp. HI00S01]|uniref:elongation factor P hydroxylase n=1 Tax=Halioglobus sp. HI00S01 TaxID=1822214 RepID=UPI0007C3284A|nr:elongation factor P hydroxylase [Halioglobus sp. HI00S01]KZX53349.1 transporting ATPase [Halioglobus sp. HI00S01]
MNVALQFTAYECSRLEHVFARCFEATEQTLLAGGASEPYYRPADSAQSQHLLYYREDFFASALHEISHWCLAGIERRQLPDFGYWYAPEGRTPEQQRAFEQVEIKPQSIEWCLSRACGYPFRVSVDNFTPDGTLPDTRWFRAQVLAQAQHWQLHGLPTRAQQIYAALCDEFGTTTALPDQRFTAADLD